MNKKKVILTNRRMTDTNIKIKESKKKNLNKKRNSNLNNLINVEDIKNNYLFNYNYFVNTNNVFNRKNAGVFIKDVSSPEIKKNKKVCNSKIKNDNRIKKNISNFSSKEKFKGNELLEKILNNKNEKNKKLNNLFENNILTNDLFLSTYKTPKTGNALFKSKNSLQTHTGINKKIENIIEVLSPKKIDKNKFKKTKNKKIKTSNANIYDNKNTYSFDKKFPNNNKVNLKQKLIKNKIPKNLINNNLIKSLKIDKNKTLEKERNKFKSNHDINPIITLQMDILKKEIKKTFEINNLIFSNLINKK